MKETPLGIMKAGMERALSGFLNVAKPGDMTSSDVVEEVRRALSCRAGHAGTLDPMARGVLVLGIGEARKFIRFLEDDKEYEAVMRLGRESDSLDADGTLSEQKPVTVTPGEIAGLAAELVGEIELPVPLYSAVHVKGRRLHELAREGHDVAAPLRKSVVHALTVLEITLPDVRFRLACSGGTYVRSIAAEWGRRLGPGAYLAELVRTRVGRFPLADALPLEDIPARAREGGIEKALLPARDALAHLPAVPCAAGTLHGRPMPVPPDLGAGSGSPVRLIGPGGSLAGIGRVTAGRDGELEIRPERMLAEAMS